MSMRINNEHRRQLMSFASKIVRENHKMTETHDKLYESIKAAAKKIVQSEYPEADLKVLRKYGNTVFAQYARFVMDNSSDVKEVNFLNDDDRRNYDDDETVKSERNAKCPEIAVNNGGRGYNKKIYRATPSLTAMLAQYELEDTEYTNTLNLKIQQYNSVINSCKTFEQLVEIWPEAALMSQALDFNLPMCLSNETIETVRAESLARMDAAKKAAEPEAPAAKSYAGTKPPKGGYRKG